MCRNSAWQTTPVGRRTKKNEISAPDLVDLLRALIEKHKAGSPTDPTVYWIHLKPPEIALLFKTTHGYKVSHGFVKRILKTLGYKYRKRNYLAPSGFR